MHNYSIAVQKYAIALNFYSSEVIIFAKNDAFFCDACLACRGH